jgi:hypothetical protein
MAEIPFYSQYQRTKAQNEAAPVREAQQAAAVVTLKQAIAEHEVRQRAQEQALAQETQLQQALQASNGDLGQALSLTMKAGNLPGALKIASLLEAQNKQAKGQPIGSGGLLLPTGHVLPPAARPQQPQQFAPPEIVRLQEHLGTLPAGDPRRAPVEARIKMLGERPAGVNVYSSSLVPGVDAQGNPVFVQPSQREGVPPRPVAGVYPPERPAAERAARERQEGEATAASVRQRIQRMASLIQGGGMAGGVVGPLGTASRIGETAVGAVRPETATPAIDYQNEQALLLADVRKLVEKDPNLSKDERERLYQTLGGGMWQTPGSALRALNNVVEYVESKKMTGPSRAARLEQAPAPAQRVKDQVYPTPRGPMRWTGTGWLPAQ